MNSGLVHHEHVQRCRWVVFLNTMEKYFYGLMCARVHWVSHALVKISTTLAELT